MLETKLAKMKLSLRFRLSPMTRIIGSNHKDHQGKVFPGLQEKIVLFANPRYETNQPIKDATMSLAF